MLNKHAYRKCFFQLRAGKLCQFLSLSIVFLTAKRDHQMGKKISTAYRPSGSSFKTETLLQRIQCNTALTIKVFFPLFSDQVLKHTQFHLWIRQRHKKVVWSLYVGQHILKLFWQMDLEIMVKTWKTEKLHKAKNVNTGIFLSQKKKSMQYYVLSFLKGWARCHFALLST